jgi:hypothetical protein
VHHRTGIVRAADIVQWRANPQVEAGSSEVRSNGEGGAESVSGSCTACQCLAIGGLKSIVSTKDHMDSARAVTGSWSTDNDVVAAVVIQVGQDHGRSKLIARDALAETGILLRQGLARSSGEAEIDLSGVTATAWHTDDQIGSSVAIHITNDWNVGLAIGLDGGRCLHRRQPSDGGCRYQYRGPEFAHAALTLGMTSSAQPGPRGRQLSLPLGTLPTLDAWRGPFGICHRGIIRTVDHPR